MKSKSFFSLFVAMAVVPLLFAYLVLKFEWYTPGATNKGEFLSQEVTLSIPSETPMWSIVYQPENDGCNTYCEEQVYAVNQTFTALGKLQKRVNAWVLTPSPIGAEFHATKALNSRHEGLSANYIYVVDPMGKVILQYPTSAERNETIQTSKHILADLKKLLNYARIG